MDADFISTVAVKRLPDGDTTDCIRRLITEALPSRKRLAGLDVAGARVVIIADFGPLLYSTQADSYLPLLTEVVNLLKSGGAQIVVGDAPVVNGLKTGGLFKRLGLPETARKNGFRLVNFGLSHLDFRLVESRLYMIPRDVLEADLIINIANASPSRELGVRGALSNLGGAVPGMRNRLEFLARTNAIEAGERVADILSIIPPDLNVLLYRNELTCDVVLVATDAVAADAVLAEQYDIVGFDSPLIKAAAGAGLGIGYIEAVKCLGNREINGLAGFPKHHSINRMAARWSVRQRIVDHYRPMINPALCVDCGICLSTCPTRAIKARNDNEKPSINRTLCQSCFRCYEVCPSGAISYHINV